MFDKVVPKKLILLSAGLPGQIIIWVIKKMSYYTLKVLLWRFFLEDLMMVSTNIYLLPSHQYKLRRVVCVTCAVSLVICWTEAYLPFLKICSLDFCRNLSDFIWCTGNQSSSLQQHTFSGWCLYWLQYVQS